MATYTDETGKSIKASNYQDAAEKLYGQGRSYQGQGQTTYAHPHRTAEGEGYAEVNVWGEGDKIGSFWGISAASPVRHILRRG